MAGQVIPRGKRTWLVRVFQGRNERGCRLYHSHTVRGTKKDATRYLNGVLHEKDLGTFAEPTRMIVSVYLDYWLKNAARAQVRARTAYEYERLLARYVRPALGHKRVAALTPLDVQTLYTAMLERKLSARTIRYTHNVLASALKQAVKWRLTTTNPAGYVNLPRLQRREMKALSLEESRRFLTAAVGTRFEALFALALATGMRPSEYLALKWGDLDLDKLTVIVQRVLTRYKKVWTFEEPKTAKSRRTIPIPAGVAKLLTAHRRKQREDRLASGCKCTPDDLVFATDSGRPLDKHNLVHNYFKPLLEKAKIDRTVRLYDLRHTCATLLMLAGENAKVVAERLGHASVILTLDTYSHVLPSMQREATERLEALLFAPT